MSKRHWLSLACVLFLGALGLSVACSGAPADAPQPTYQPTATIKDLMLSIVDPSADEVWDAVTTVVSSAGVVDRAPETEEQWTVVRNGAVTLMESANLLLMPGRHMAAPGEVSETPGVELEPLEMEALVNQDRATWNTQAQALHTAAHDVLLAVEGRDAQRIFELGENIERACENCHVHYWYPNEQVPTE